VPEFEVRLSSIAEKNFKIIDAKSEEAVLAAALAKKHGASFFELRRPLSQRWVRRD
jgi:hypothetical protein